MKPEAPITDFQIELTFESGADAEERLLAIYEFLLGDNEDKK